MATLREKMAEHGFESNIDYAYHVNCLLSQAGGRTIPTLNVEGDSGRRKTAFANALAEALGYPHVLYHDFTQLQDPEPVAAPPGNPEEGGPEEPPIPAFERVISSACAYSEGEKTVLILDQLQAADFREHLRLYHFIKEARWRMGDAEFVASPENLLLLLIAEEPLYHSLQQAGFTVWVPRASLGDADYVPEDFGLGPEAAAMMARLGELFRALGVQPTPSEFRRLLFDIEHNVRTREELSHSIYGWVEGIDHTRLVSGPLQKRIENLMPDLWEFLGMEHLELSGDGPEPL
ncbi:MAG: hypothetical protein ACQETK_04035 [Pseudomonadota bacterium]